MLIDAESTKHVDFRDTTVGPEAGSGGHSENCILVKFEVEWYYFSLKLANMKHFWDEKGFCWFFSATKLPDFSLKATNYRSLFSKFN